MKQLFILTIALLFLMASQTQAKKWRVNNNPGIDADTSSFAGAVADASSGDTIYLEPSGISYVSANLDINKKLVIIGPGYFLGQNPLTQANQGEARLDYDLNLYEGSDGTVIMGCHFTQDLRVDYSTNNILIKRNYFSGNDGRIILENSNTAGSNIMIVENYLHYNYGGSTYKYRATIDVTAGYSNLLIMNNFIKRTNPMYSTINAITIESNSSAIIQNNVIYGDINNQSKMSSFTNNIFLNTNSVNDTLHDSFSNNISETDKIPGRFGSNMANVDMTEVFDTTCATCLSMDGMYQINPASFAATYADHGGEVGMFGGTNPYVLSGIPPIPAIYFYDSPTSGSSSTGLDVEIGIKSNK